MSYVKYQNKFVESQGKMCINTPTPPVPLTVTLYNGLTVNMEPSLSAPVSANYLLQDLNHGGTAPYYYELSTDGGSNWTTPNTDPTSAIKNLSCSDIGTVFVDVRVKDSSAPQRTGTGQTFVDLQDPMDYCGA